MNLKNWIWIVALTLLVIGVVAAPHSPTELVNEGSDRRDVSSTGWAVPAQAGNVSELRINTSTITQGWQGYYGNISGTIVLDDANNNSMYTWDLVDPEGEIYATRDSDGIDWSGGNIICAMSAHVETEESTLNFNLGGKQDVDGINETFKEGTHPGFNVSTNDFSPDVCNYTVSTYVDDGADSNRVFNETLLYSTSDSALIYTALIVAGGADGFKADDTQYDFQMLVAEDGHNGDTSVTDYYFYVEIS